jgi:hypothetical protein
VTSRAAFIASFLVVAMGGGSAMAAGDVTIYDNAQSVPIGGRAAGMAGAYTALACDEGALHYNPASLSCAASSHLELTANAYVLQGLRATGALGPGRNVGATTFHSIPSIVGAVRILREGRERTHFDTYPERLTFGFAVSVPRTVALRVDTPNPDQQNAASFSIREDLTAGDLGLGYQLNREVSIGISLGAVLRTSERHAQWLLVRNGSSDFLTFANDRSSFAVDARAKIGVLVRPYDNLSFGLVLTAPSFGVLGSAKESSTFSTSASGVSAAVPLRASGNSEVALPARVVLGFAYVRKRYTFSGDVSLNFARDVRLAYDMKPEVIAGAAPPSSVPDMVLTPVMQPNLNAGASVPFGKTKEVNIGFFTDFSSVSQGDIERNSLSRVHMFGSSLTVGFLGKQARLWVGVAGEIGQTTTRVPGRGFTFERVSALPPGRLPDDGEATLVRWTATGILGSNYSFLE